MVHVTQALCKYIPSWYHLRQSASSFFQKQALLKMMRFSKKREWSSIKNANNRYYYMLKSEQVYARDKSRAKKDINRTRIHAGCLEHGYEYRFLQPTLIKLGIYLNSSSLSRLSIYEPKTFKALVDISKEASNEELQPANFDPDRILSKTEFPRQFAPKPSIRR